MFRLVVQTSSILSLLMAALSGGAFALGHGIPTELLAYTSNRRTNLEIYIQDMRWMLPARLTHNSEWADTPAWSMDGRLAYAANYSGNWEIYIHDLATGETTDVTQDNDHNDYSPAWSADGRLAYVSASPNDFGSLRILDTATGAVYETHQIGQNPSWSADGRLTYASNASGTWEIYVYDMGQDSVIDVTHDENIDEWSPSWSPDGKEIAFMANENRNSDIFVLNLETGERVNVTNHPADDLFPKWSADGRLAFMSSRSGNAEIYVLDVVTGVTTQATSNIYYDTSPAWVWQGLFDR